MNISAIDLVVIVVYMVIIVRVGCRAARRWETVSEVCKSLVERGFDITVNGKKRDTLPRAKLLDGQQEAKIIALRLSDPPGG